MKNLMKKVYLVLKNVVCVVLFFAILINIMAFWAPLFRYEEDHLTTGAFTGFYAEDENSLDIVFIGASSVYRYMAPTLLYEKYGITSMNFASASMPTESMSGLIDEVIDKQSPKLIVLEVRDFIKWVDRYEKGVKSTDEEWLVANESYINRIVDNMPPSKNRAKVVHDTIKPLLNKNEFDWQFEYYRTHNNWKDLKISDVVNYAFDKIKGKKEIVNIDGKYLYGDYKGTSTMKYIKHCKEVDYKDYDKVEKIPDKYMGVMDALVEKAKTCGTDVLFLTTPYPEPAKKAAYENYLAQYYKEKGVDYLNCNKLYDEIGIDFEWDFYDAKHTNIRGAIKVTNYVGDYMVKKYNLKPTKLTKSQKAEWDTALEKWNEEVRVPGLEYIEGKIAASNS